MISVNTRKSSLHFLCAFAIVALFAFNANSQVKKAAPAPPKAAAPAKSAAGAGAAKSGATGANAKAVGPTTGGAHGPTTSGATTGGAKTTTTGSRTTTTGAGSSKTAATGTRTTGTGAGAGVGAKTGTGAGAGAGVGAKMANGRPVPSGSHMATTTHGDQVRMRPNGRPADVHVAGRNMDIHNGLNGGRRVEVVRADHSRIVAERGGRGYVEHPYRYGGRDYAARSYYYNGRAYNRYYGSYYYGGGYVNYYTPAFYYRPAFYGWAYNPWAVPFAYSWGFAANPWYGFYGAAYFTPYPVYASASLWLTDYLISQSLQAAYAAQAAAAQSQALAAGAAGLTPDVKELISAEVQRQIALENAEAQTAQTAAPDPASSSIQRMLTDNVQHIFIVGQNLDIINSATNGECAVSQGDALQLAGPPAADATAANLVVLSSKGGVECPKSATVQVQISDLQEMQNHMRETIDAGMGDLKTKQGTGGIPALPTSAAGEPVKATFVSAAPPPDPNAGAEINQQLQAADQAQSQVVAEVPKDGSAPALVADAASRSDAPPAAPITLGQSIDDVTAAMGQPTRIVDLGVKKIYIYKDMKITFKAGKVADVQ